MNTCEHFASEHLDKMLPRNTERAARLFDQIAFVKGKPIHDDADGIVSDCFVNLMHLCDALGKDFFHEVERASRHYACEIEPDEDELNAMAADAEHHHR